MPDFEVVTRTEQPTAVIHDIVPMKELPQFFQCAYSQVYAVMQAQGVAPSGGPIALYFGKPTDRVEVEVGFPIAKEIEPVGAVQAGALPGGKCAHGLHVGPYDQMVKTYGELMQWMDARHLRPHEQMWEVYLSDPAKEPDPQRWRTEIFWPVD